jgi:uncharacterized protein YjbK
MCALRMGVQENYFFDGHAKELNSRFVVLRVRFYDVDKKAVLTLKVCNLAVCHLSVTCAEHCSHLCWGCMPRGQH